MSKKTKELEKDTEYLRSVITKLKEKLDFVADDVIKSNNYVQALERVFKPKAYLGVSYYLLNSACKGKIRNADIINLPITIYDKITRNLYLVNKSEEYSSKSNCQVVSMLFKRDK